MFWLFNFIDNNLNSSQHFFQPKQYTILQTETIKENPQIIIHHTTPENLTKTLQELLTNNHQKLTHTTKANLQTNRTRRRKHSQKNTRNRLLQWNNNKTIPKTTQ